MLEVSRPETRTTARSQPQPLHFRWGIVDVVLGVLMLPFGIWMFAIEGMVRAVAAVGKR